jgi:putative transcriptional regulator
MPSHAPEIKHYLRRLRVEQGEMTQDRLAKEAGATRHTIMALEAGKYFPQRLLAFPVPSRYSSPWSRHTTGA